MADITREIHVSLVDFEEADAVAQLYKRIRFPPQEALGVIDAKLGEESLPSRTSKRLRLGRAAAAVLNLRIRVRDAKRLRSDSKSSAVHHRHGVSDQTETAFSD